MPPDRFHKIAMYNGFLIALIAYLSAAPFAMSVEIPKNHRGLAVNDEIGTYREIVARHPERAMINLETFVPGIDLDIKYATTDNFMGEVLYPVAQAFLRKPAAEALKKAQKTFAAHGVALRIFDAYRPYSITEKMWERSGPSDYLADPARGSRHNRGCAVDATLVSLKTGQPLKMPTPYDDFTERAHPDFEDLPDDVRANRELLRSVMERHGFEVYRTEWWHFDFRGWDQFELMNIPLEELGAALADAQDRSPHRTERRGRWFSR